MGKVSGQGCGGRTCPALGWDPQGRGSPHTLFSVEHQFRGWIPQKGLGVQLGSWEKKQPSQPPPAPSPSFCVHSSKEDGAAGCEQEGEADNCGWHGMDKPEALASETLQQPIAPDPPPCDPPELRRAPGHLPEGGMEAHNRNAGECVGNESVSVTVRRRLFPEWTQPGLGQAWPLRPCPPLHRPAPPP